MATYSKELIDKFKMKQTSEAGNLKSHIGEYFQVEKWETSEYCDVNTGELHTVLALSILGTENTIYRTEVKAFIEKFRTYAEVFGDVPPAERPYIKITGKTSRKKNEYISFDICDESGEPL